ncbi:MAG: IS630 family transposase [Thermomicrobiales bacterium]|nr:IS630 family transposase [Thermomicrobiales bacterium]
MQRWVIPPGQNGAFVAAMEDVLAVYARPADPARPLVCFDEAGKELRAERRSAQPPAPGRAAREDAEYIRQGSANLFLALAPHQGWRQVTVTAQRTGRDFASVLRALLDGPFAHADQIVLVTDNLNTHRPAAFSQTFPPAEARRLLARIEWHFTPLHGSWLNMAELEWSVLARQCLPRRMPDQATLAAEVAAWVAARNADRVGIDWRFTMVDARARLPFLYPDLSGTRQ